MTAWDVAPGEWAELDDEDICPACKGDGYSDEEQTVCGCCKGEGTVR